MRDERGFTLTEMTSALLVLSFGMVSLGEITSLLFRSWTHTQTQNQTVRAAAQLAEEILSIEQALKSDAEELQPLALSTDGDESIVLARPRVDRAPDCDFDLVGRRCRE